MRLIFHILKKDASHLWPHALAFAALLATLACSDIVYGLRVDALSSVDSFFYGPLAYIALPLACWNLVIALIHGEGPVGDRQYWLTRPYRWTDLVAAKAMFIVVFVNLPVFLCQCAILASVGIAPLSFLGALLWRQVFFTALLALPAVALAAVTRTLAQSILGAFLVLLPAGVFYSLMTNRPGRFDWGPEAWIRDSAVAAIVLLGSAGIVLLQYWRRRTALSRGALAGTAAAAVLIAALVPPAGTFGIQALVSRRPAASSAVRILIEPAANLPLHDGNLFPVRVAGVPTEMEIYVVRVEAVVDIPGQDPNAALDAKWSSGEFSLTDSSLSRPSGNGRYWLQTNGALTPWDSYRQRASISPVPVRIHGWADIALFEPVQTMFMPDAARTPIPGLGVCMSRPVECYSPFPRYELSAETEDGRAEIVPKTLAFAPFPTSPSFVPLERFLPPALARFRNGRYFVDWESTIALVSRRPVVFFRREFDFRGVRLAEYFEGRH